MRKDLWGPFIILCGVWGSTWLAIKIGVSAAPPIFLAGSRFFVAGGLLLGWYRLTQGPIRVSRQHWAMFGWLGTTVIAICFGLIFWGEQVAPSGVTAVLVQGVIPAAMMVFSTALNKEPISRGQVMGLVGGAVGMMLVFLPGDTHVRYTTLIFRMAGIVVGTLSYCFGSVISKQTLSEYPAIVVAALENLIGGLLLLVWASMFEGSRIVDYSTWMRFPVVASWGYLVLIGSIVGFSLYVYLLKEMGSVRVSAYAYVTPVIGLALGAGIAHETLSWTVVLGTLLLLSATWTVLSRRATPQVLTDSQ